ncbi:hypothetical protein HQ535_16395, partial [bacterium]|nr:hypothetical protein [bacterium]
MAMSEEHKAALALGRRESRAVKKYLEALASRKPGRPVSPERLGERIAELGQRIAAEQDPLKALEYRQARLDAERQLEQLSTLDDFAEVEAGFVASAGGYSQRKG